VSKTNVGGAELVAVVGQTAPLAKVQDLKMVRSSLSMKQQGNINSERMFHQIENILARDCSAQGLTCVGERFEEPFRHVGASPHEPLRQRLDRRGRVYLPFMEVGHENLAVVMECLGVLIEERQRENSALGKRSASELDQSGDLVKS
jgi:hypothetical protein